MQALKKIGSTLQWLGSLLLYWTIMFLSVVAVLFQLGWEMLKVGYFQAKEYLETANINKESRRVQAQINLQEKKQKLADMPPASPTDNIDKGVAAGNLQDELMSKGLDFNKIFLCKIRKSVTFRNQLVFVGDEVILNQIDLKSGRAIIESLVKRTNLLQRPSVANISNNV